MNWYAWLALVVASHLVYRTNAKAVFAHFMVTNSQNYTASDWESDMKLAQDAHIDAFALNMAWQDSTNDISVEAAFDAAGSVGFKLFFSFDYAGNGPWSKDTVISMIQQYGSNGAYFLYNGQPFVSTFEGPGNADDWVEIKAQTNCYFIPDWSSVGAKPAAALANGVADGLFSWSAWPWGNQTMDTYTDASYLQYLEGKPYMMAISPWFYTNLPGYDKNWLWKGDSLWFDRWQELLGLDPMPEFVEIISWNDYGESHYIGPIYEKSMAAFDIGDAPFNYALNFPHDGWRDVLPFLIDLYKTGKADVTEDKVVIWYRPHPVSACSTGGTTLNTAQQLQIEFDPADGLEDRIYILALFTNGNHEVIVINAGGTGYPTWESMPNGEGGSGLWFGTYPATPGEVAFNLIYGETQTGSLTGIDISSTCPLILNNYNAWVGSFTGTSSESATIDLEGDECIKGKGAYDFNDLCAFTCSYGYCPVGACTCEQIGSARTKPKATGVTGYPAEGRDANYEGLCSFACNYGYCPSKTCDTVEHSMPIPTVSDFLPPACISGTGEDDAMGLCSYACNYGYCPINVCTCTATGPLIQPPAQTNMSGMAAPGHSSSLDDLCDFTCSRGYCPEGTCEYNLDSEISTFRPNLNWGGTGNAICSASQKPVILQEFRFAMWMAETARDDFQTWSFYKTFFSDTVRADPDFATKAAGVYANVGLMLDGSEFGLQITCDFTAAPCTASDPNIAFMNAGRKTMNICPGFFTNTKITATADKFQNPPASIIDAHHTRSAVLLHEMTHSKFAMKTVHPSQAKDFAYGWESCKLLAEGTFNRGCQRYAGLKGNLCADPSDPSKDGICDAKFSLTNADTWAVVAAGIFFSENVGTEVPLVPPSSASDQTGSELSTAATSGCVQYNPLMFDQGSAFEISGLVSFGDSFAAGMGTGVTTSDNCRVGQFNYGDLIYQQLQDNSVSMERKVCSGDTTTGLARQIQEWNSQSSANLATLTIGGNDLGFTDIVWNCILTPATWHFGSTYRQWCIENEDKARALMNDQGETGLRYKLRTLYKQILEKGQEVDLSIFVTGYPEFFNENTTDCDQSTFHYFWSGYQPPSDWWYNRLVHLTTEFRAELNLLVSQLNDVIIAAIQDANTEAGSTRVYYVDVQSKFDSHRWCEQGIHEPDSSAPNTYFFLSGWKDLPLEGSDTVTSSDASDISYLEQNGIDLPDPSNCETALGSDPDPWQKWLCLVSIAISQEPDGPIAWSYGNATQAIQNGNYNAQDISDWFFTRQIKAFHPRSPGMGLYRDAILEKIDTTIGQ
ncbi:mutanase [Aspergillus violaceofuscus CBS 115571]|uniref:Mutanase n=1 Tax=Aspergillus violaceofuscus (strain CBS 115571) TaxID=1450538 RepID=A0A2V5GXE4_ASPV1|nr:mutanase [Aspergillus violaceofuscus CBS 115571]